MFDLSDLDDDKAIVMAGELLDELAAARSAVELYERRVIGVRKMIDGLVEMFPAVEDVLPEDYDGDDEARPRGAEAAYGVMSDAPGTWLTVGNIVSRLEQRAWLPDSSNPANAVRTALERLVDDGRIEKARSTERAVIYRVPPPIANDPPDGGYEEEPF